MIKLLYSIIGVVMVISIIYIFLGDDQQDYIEKITSERMEKDRVFKSEESPLPQNEINSFQGLAYYPPNPNYKIKARLNKIESMDIFKTTTSDGSIKNYYKHSYASFILDDTPCKLLILKPITSNEDYLFLAFYDQTSSIETYEGGRYLEITSYKNNIATIDFNMAYNPFCVYNKKYSCPIPPSDNYLPIAIKAGEKNLKNK